MFYIDTYKLNAEYSECSSSFITIMDNYSWYGVFGVTLIISVTLKSIYQNYITKWHEIKDEILI